MIRRMLTGRSVLSPKSSIEVTMSRRLIFAAIAALAGVFFGLQPAKAEAPWCAVITIGEDSVIWDCRYRSVEECRPKCVGWQSWLLQS